MVEKQFEAFHTFLWLFFLSLKQDFIAYHSSKASLRPGDNQVGYIPIAAVAVHLKLKS